MISSTSVLTMLDKAYKALPEDQKNIADVIISGKWYKNEPIIVAEPSFNDLGATFDKSIGALIGEMIRAFKADVTLSENKKNKSGVNRSVIVKLIKAATRANAKETAKYTIIEKSGKQTYCDGIFAFTFAETDNTLPIMPENLISTAFKPEEKLFVGLREQKSTELELPSLKLLENYVKNNGKGIHTSFSFGYDLPVVRADYLVTIMKAVPGARFYMTGSVLTPIYGVDEDGNEAALCPIRVENPMPRTEV